MAELSKGKQPVRSHRPSGLRHVEQVPDSDTAIPDTQLDTVESHYGSEAEDGLELSPEDWALLGRLQSKRTGDGSGSSQSPLPPAQTFGITKPDLTTTVDPSSSFGFARRTTNNTSPKEDATALQHSIQDELVLSSIEQVSNAANKQNASTAPAPPPTQSPPTTQQLTTIDQSKNAESQAFEDQSQASTSLTAATCVDNSDTGHLESEPPISNTVANPTSHATTQLVPTLKETRNGIKAKRGKKMLLSRPLVPWPPRHSPVPSRSNLSSSVESSGNSRSLEHNVEASISHNAECPTALAQKSYPHTLADRLGDTETQSPEGEVTSLDAAASIDHAVNEAHLNNSSHTNSSGAIQHRVHFSPAAQRPTNVTAYSSVPGGQSSFTSQDGHVAHVQLRQIPTIDREITGGAPLACSSILPSPKLHSKSRPALRIMPQHSKLDRTQTPPPRSDTAHDGLHRPSSRDGPIRVTKIQKKTRPVQSIHARASTPIDHSRTLSGMTALDIALDSIRTACIVDQDRMQDQITSTVNLLKEDKMQLQNIMLEQQTTIAELRVQLRTSEENLARLIEKAKTNQRYVAGLQKDYEKCQKSALAFHEHNKQVLQDKIAELVKEKASLQDAIDSTIESFTNARKKMMQTIEETHMHYVITLSMKKDLGERLSEQARMYEEEKCRRTELEKQLLPSLQSIQRQLSESSASLIDKLSSLDISLQNRAAKDRDDCGVKDCLQILQKLDSMPLLTSHDFQKAEGMLRFIQERTEAGFEHLAETSRSITFPIEEIRQYTHDQIQGLRTEILRHDQAIADGNLARMTSESLRLELNNQKQNQQRLEEQVILLRQSELALKSSVTRLEREKDELQATVKDHETRPREFERKIMQLHDQLSQAKNDLILANNAAKQKERLRQEQVLEFRKYRLSTLIHHTSLKEQVQQTTNQLQLNEHEKNGLQQDISDLKIKLGSIQTNCDSLNAEVSQNKSIIDTLRQENDRLSEKYGTSQMSLRSVEDEKLALEVEKEELSTTLKDLRMSLCESNDVEAKLNARCLDLQRQLSKLEEANKSSDEQLQQAQNETSRFQQAKENYAMEIEDLTSRLNLSENARKESQAKVRQMETVYKQQIECHHQEANAKFERLVLESERGREELEAKHAQALKRRKQEAVTKTKDPDQRIDDKRNRLSGKTNIPNSQPPFIQDVTPTASPQSQTETLHKNIDRQTDSVLPVAPLNNWRFNNDRRGFAADRSNLPHSRCEGSEHQTGFFEEEYRNRFGSQVAFQDHETKPALIDPEIEVVPETQESEYAQRSTEQLEVVESQVSALGNVNPDDALSDLSTMPSEDLSEMLLDARSNPGRGNASSRHLSSPKDAMNTIGRLGHDTSQDIHSTASQSRPKSQANTASRMMPLSTSDIQRQHKQTHDISQHHTHVRSDRTFKTDDSGSPEFMHTISATSKQTYGHRPSARDNSRTGDMEASQKRKALGSHTEQDSPFKKLRNSAQCYIQRPPPISKNNSPYMSAPNGVSIHSDIHPSPSSATSRRSRNRQSTIAPSQAGTPLLSSTRNTRSKTNRYADRFGQELDRR